MRKFFLLSLFVLVMSSLFVVFADTSLNTSVISNYSGDFQIFHHFNVAGGISALLNGTTDITNTNACYGITEGSGFFSNRSGRNGTSCASGDYIDAFYPNITTFSTDDFTCIYAVEDMTAANDALVMKIHDSDIATNNDAGSACNLRIAPSASSYALQACGSGCSSWTGFSPSFSRSTLSGTALMTTFHMNTDTCTYFVLNATTGVIIANITLASYQANLDKPKFSVYIGDTGSRYVIDDLRCWNSTHEKFSIPAAVPVYPDVPPVEFKNMTWNVSIDLKAPSDGLEWRNGSNVSVASNLVSFTLNTTHVSNMSCRLGVDQNYTMMVLNNSNYMAATTDTTNHSYTVFDNLIANTSQCLYCAFSYFNMSGINKSQSGCLNIFASYAPPSGLPVYIDTVSCPSTFDDWIPHILYIALAVLMFLVGFVFRKNVLGFIGGVFMIIISLNIAGCNEIFAFVLIIASLYLMAVFGARIFTTGN